MPPKTLEELMAPGSAWPYVEAWIGRAKNAVEILPGDRARGEDALSVSQIGLDTPLGSIAFHTGGLLVDHGWVRVLGAGHPKVAGSLTSWNAETRGALWVGYDVVGGFFAMDLGALRRKLGNILYFAPDELRWLDLEVSYAEWLAWLFGGDLVDFNKGVRWETWREDVEALEGAHGFAFEPPLSAKGMPIDLRQRRSAPILELWAAQLGRAMGGKVRSFRK